MSLLAGFGCHHKAKVADSVTTEAPLLRDGCRNTLPQDCHSAIPLHSGWCREGRHLDGNKGAVAGVVAVADAAHEDGHVAIQAALCCRMRAAIGCLLSIVADVILGRIVQDGPDAVLLQILRQLTNYQSAVDVGTAMQQASCTASKCVCWGSLRGAFESSVNMRRR